MNAGSLLRLSAVSAFILASVACSDHHKDVSSAAAPSKFFLTDELKVAPSTNSQCPEGIEGTWAIPGSQTPDQPVYKISRNPRGLLTITVLAANDIIVADGSIQNGSKGRKYVATCSNELGFQFSYRSASESVHTSWELSTSPGGVGLATVSEAIVTRTADKAEGKVTKLVRLEE